jgi:NADH dehydrogenase
MTVMVTGASGVVGRAVVKALLARDEVRATVRRPEAAEPLRGLGAKVSVRRGDPAEGLEGLLGRCHTLVHLVGGPNQPDAHELFGSNHGSTLSAVRAAGEAGVTRVVLISVPGADPDSAQPFLRAKGLAEEAVRASGLEHAIVRATHVFGLGGLWFTAAVEGALAEPPFVPGPGTQEIAPLHADDLGAVVAAIDDRAAPIAGTWAIEGPEVLTADGFCRLLRGDAVAPVHADGQPAADALSRLLGIRVDAVAATYLALPSRADAPDAAEAFGVARTPLLEGLRITLEAASHLDVVDPL